MSGYECYCCLQSMSPSCSCVFERIDCLVTCSRIVVSIIIIIVVVISFLPHKRGILVGWLVAEACIHPRITWLCRRQVSHRTDGRRHVPCLLSQRRGLPAVWYTAHTHTHTHTPLPRRSESVDSSWERGNDDSYVDACGCTCVPRTDMTRALFL